MTYRYQVHPLSNEVDGTSVPVVYRVAILCAELFPLGMTGSYDHGFESQISPACDKTDSSGRFFSNYYREKYCFLLSMYSLSNTSF